LAGQSQDGGVDQARGGRGLRRGLSPRDARLCRARAVQRLECGGMDRQRVAQRGPASRHQAMNDSRATIPSAGGTLSARTHEMLHAPLVATLLRLAMPNIMGLFAMTLIIGYDGFILGRLGANALAGIALVLPLSMLMLQMSNG